MSRLQGGVDRGTAAPAGTGGLRLPRGRQLMAFAVVGLFLMCACGVTTLRAGAWIAAFLADRGSGPASGGAKVLADWPSNSAVLTAAVSESMAETLDELAGEFNRRRERTPDGELMRIELVTLSPRAMVEESLGQPGFQAVAPDSSLWLVLIEQRWRKLFPTGESRLPESRVGPSTRFAVSPIVVAAEVETARLLGWPQLAVGWGEVLGRATAPPTGFSWGRPGPANTAGVLATLSAFYAGAGVTRGLTQEVALQHGVVEYVRTAESTALEIGPGDDATGGREVGVEIGSAAEGLRSGILDVAVVEEQAVIAANRSWNRSRAGLGGGGRDGRDLPPGHLVAIYPREGTLWADHPLALLELDGRAGPALTQNQRRTYRSFTNFLLGKESQQALLEAGFRPVDLTLDLHTEPSPFAIDISVDPLLPQTSLPLPSRAVIEMALEVWRYTRPPANIVFVVDTSESMDGSKLAKTKAALHGFLAQIEGDRDKVGLVAFGTGVADSGGLRRLDETGRGQMSELIDRMEAGGTTNLIDAMWTAHSVLQDAADAEAINAIVVLTDGRDNDSERSLRALRAAMQEARIQVAVHAVAFGRDADEELLKAFADIGGGQFHRLDETNVEELYRLIATEIRALE